MSRRSHDTNSGRSRPVAAIASWRCAAAARSMSTKATFEPWAQKCSTMDAPMPLAPPVTRTTRSRKLGYVAYVMGSSLGMRVSGGVTAHTLARGRLARTARPPVASLRMESITLRRDSLGVTLAPGIGGSIARFWRAAGGGELDFLRPTPPDALARGEPGRLSSFPLVPWSNRIRAGRFPFEGRAVALTPNLRGHAIHGLGYRTSRTLGGRRPARAVLAHPHAGGEGPGAF